MKDEQLLERISLDIKVMAGKPVVKGTRLAVDHILNRLAHGDEPSELLSDYDYLKPEDIRACLLYASRCMNDITNVSLASE